MVCGNPRQDIAAARVPADGGHHSGAARILDSSRKAVRGAAGDPTCEALSLISSLASMAASPEQLS